MPPRTYPLRSISTEQLIVVPVSFETNEVGTINLPTLPFRCKLKTVKSVVTKVMGSSNSGTIAVKKGGTTLATVTIVADAVVGTENAAPTVADTPFDQSDQVVLTTAKSTAGGRALCYLTVEVLPSH